MFSNNKGGASAHVLRLKKSELKDKEGKIRGLARLTGRGWMTSDGRNLNYGENVDIVGNEVRPRGEV